MDAKDNSIILILGLIISIVSISLAFLKINFWYFPAVIGVWLFFDYFSSIKNNNTAIQILRKNKKDFLRLYIFMFMFGCTIEIIGRFILRLWFYPSYTNVIFDLVNLIFYPFILLSFREMYNSIKIICKNWIVTTILSMLLGIIIWEIPNLYSKDWIYTIPFISFEILHLNIIVIIGWSILILGPLIIYKITKL
jgi:hypothetical protein